MRRRGFCLGIMILLLAGVARAASEPIYDESVDAKKQIAAAIREASRRRHPARNVVLVFGANWCQDCRVLDAQMHEGDLASLIAKNFVVVKIDVGRMDKNLDLAAKYGVPVRNGIPALAVLNSRGKLLYAQDQGQFADARHMSYENIKAFFDQWKPKGRKRANLTGLGGCMVGLLYEVVHLSDHCPA
ncbi:MAG: thioredoxin family protein [Acidobacteriia bacterium]|nr:thioredoxin family protein [Terriglobia bacterium]